MALHHPIRLAEQLAVIDNITKGRLIVGLGRGSSYNIYDYQGFGIDHHEAQARLDEAEEIMVRSWTEGEFQHHGRFWNLQVPMLRPRPHTKPHPPLIRAASGEASMLELARQGRPLLMNVQSSATTRRRFELYPEAMAEAGFDHESIARNLDDCWVWRNVFVADTDVEAERIGIPAFQAMGRGAGRIAQPHLSRNWNADRRTGERSAVSARQRRPRLYLRVAAARRRSDRRNRRSRRRRGYRDFPPRAHDASSRDEQPAPVHDRGRAPVPRRFRCRIGSRCQRLFAQRINRISMPIARFRQA
jgi:alkanesulfonate monooxygenase SsuD/methylene tetrahydromethanopterin reductase-like flavin-dependent oxidoreductase (luciferase family)